MKPLIKTTTEASQPSLSPVLKKTGLEELERRRFMAEVDSFIKSGRQHISPSDLRDPITMEWPQTPVQIAHDPSQTVFDLASLRLWNTSSAAHPTTRASLVGAQIVPVAGQKLSEMVAFLGAVQDRLLALGSAKRAKDVGCMAADIAHRAPVLEALLPPLMDPMVGPSNRSILAALNPQLSCNQLFTQWTAEKELVKQRVDNLRREPDYNDDIFSHSRFATTPEDLAELLGCHTELADKLSLLGEQTERAFPTQLQRSRHSFVRHLPQMAEFLLRRVDLGEVAGWVDYLTIFTTMRMTTERNMLVSLPEPRRITCGEVKDA